MTIRQVGIRPLVEQYRLDSHLGHTEASRAHSRHRVVPAPSLVPVPIVANPFKSLAHDRHLSLRGQRENTHSAEDSRVVACETDILVGIDSRLGGEIETILVESQRRERLDNLVPLSISW